VLHFRVEEMGQLVLLPNPCTHWQAEDLDGNKMRFQVV
jgi:hypothetical protein